MVLGSRIKLLRKEKNLSQGELAQQVGTDARQISRYENGHITPSVEVVAKLAQVLDVSVDYLLFEDSPRRPLKVEDQDLLEKLQDVQHLSEEDRTSILHILDALVAKSKIKSFAQGLG
jgi:transcriptional regulator with XRE-family HTH domain